ncbi:S41 family peptidase [Patescibacteria group bacterium]|nr:S41 family peptidase [Patescibacteria group bacterium]
MLSKKQFKIPIIVVLIAIIFIVGFFIGKSSVPNPALHDRMFFNKDLGKPDSIDFSLFWQALRELEEKFVESDKIDYQELLYGAISGMTESLGDDYTIFMKPEKTDSFIESVSGNENFEGVGMEIAIKEKILTIVAPLEGTPAYQAGLKSGDKILEIDGESTEGLLIEEAVSKIRGEKGTSVVLTIIRPNLDSPKEFSIIRDTINVPVVRWEPKENNIGYVKIYRFAGNLPSKFEDIVSEMLNNDVKKIVLDLRNNPGGYLEVSQEIASWFLPKGELVLKEEFKDGAINEYKSKGYKHLQDLPVVVLINKGSASASEILAGALRDIKSSQLVGEQTFGKGSVQTLENFRDGSSLKITIAKWLTPSGISIADDGLKPDIEIELTQEDFDNNKDPQLEKALELLK